MRFLYSRRTAPWLLLAPALVLGTVFYGVPIATSVGLSLTDWNALEMPHWRGLDNYAVLLTDDPFFLNSVSNTLLLAGGSAAMGIPAALLLALAVARSRHPAWWRTIFWLPSVTNIVAAAYAWQFVLNPTYGVVNRMLAVFGVAGPDWLTQPAPAMASLMLVIAWTSVGQNMLLFATGLEAIDPALLEAARSDGANGWQVAWHVSLPLLQPTLLFVLVSTLITGVGTFALVLVMTGGGPNDNTTVTSLYMYRMAFESLRIGRACAVAVLLAAVTMALSLLQLRYLSREL